MKKYLVALIVALMVCMVGVSASAEEGQMDEVIAIVSDVMNEQECKESSSGENVQKAKEAFEAAGWTIVNDSGISAQSEDIDPEVLELAYMDIDEADPELKDKILEAREKVIYSYSWANDIDVPGGISYYANPETREISFLPLFSELFPGWEVPVHDYDLSDVPLDGEECDVESIETQDSLIDDVVNGIYAARSEPYTLKGPRFVPTASSGLASPLFQMSAYANYANTFHFWPSEFQTSGMTTINVGLNTNTGKDLAFRMRVKVGDGGVVYTVPNSSYLTFNTVRARASTMAKPGNAYFYFQRTLV